MGMGLKRLCIRDRDTISRIGVDDVGIPLCDDYCHLFLYGSPDSVYLFSEIHREKRIKIKIIFPDK